MKITILSIGNKPNSSFQTILDDWQKRLSSRLRIRWKFYPHSKGDVKSAIQSESSLLSAKIPNDNYVILLDEHGTQYSSTGFSELLFSCNKDVTFIIGGAYGVDDKLRSKTNAVWSISNLVFPHQLVRLILIEQIYRADCIQRGHPYHHG